MIWRRKIEETNDYMAITEETEDEIIKAIFEETGEIVDRSETAVTSEESE